MIFRNHSNILICCSRNISDYYQCWKQLCCFIFLWKLRYIFSQKTSYCPQTFEQYWMNVGLVSSGRSLKLLKAERLLSHTEVRGQSPALWSNSLQLQTTHVILFSDHCETLQLCTGLCDALARCQKTSEGQHKLTAETNAKLVFVFTYSRNLQK